MGYYIDLERISIDDYQKKLESAYLPPSRQILKENLDERFKYFKSIGIENVIQLLQFLKKKDKFKELSNISCFTEDYLAILLRELKSMLPKPNKIDDFTIISKEIVARLEKVGIKNSEKLFYKVKTKLDRKELAKLIQIKEEEVLLLTKLSDLSRIKWVGAMYAQILYSLKVDTVEKVSKSNPIDLHKRINQMIKEKGIFKGQIGLNDVNILVETANEVPLEIEY